MLLISAIVPAYNAAAHLGACIDSILGQRGPFRLEVIIVDDGSADDTGQVAAALAANDPRVRVLHQANAGPSAARNLGIAVARGDWIAFLDSDDLWPADRLRTQLALLDAAPDLGLIFGDCAIFDAEGLVLPSFFADAGLDAGFWGDPVRVPDAWPKLFRINYIPTGAVLVRRTCLDLAGGFDPGLRLVEDLDLWLRVARQCRFGYTPALCQRKRRHGGNVSADLAAMTLANIQVLRRHWRAHRRELRRLGVRLRPYLAAEYCLLGDYSERAGRPAEARGWFLRALFTAPSPRPVYYWLRSLLGGGRHRQPGA